MIKGKKVVRGVEGINLTIVCIVESGRPPVETLVLSINGSNITNEGSDRITYSFIPTKLDNMKLFTCFAYSSFILNPLLCEARLDIRYSPVVEIRRKLTKNKLILICNPSGNPENYTFGDWEHWSEFKEHIRNVQGTPDGSLIMKYTIGNRLDGIDGIYKCKTSNGIHGTNGLLYQTGSVLINNKGIVFPPKFVNSNKQIQIGRYGKEINLTVLVYNKYGTLKTNLSKRNKSLNAHEIQESIEIHEMVYDVNVTLACITITFQLTLDEIEDFTDYTIEACNKKGCHQLTVKIKSENKRKREKWRRSEPVIDNMQTRMSKILFNMSPQTRYLVRVLSTNAIGESKMTAVTPIMTLAIHSSGEKSQSVQGIVIVVMVLVNIVIGAGIGLLVLVNILKLKLYSHEFCLHRSNVSLYTHAFICRVITAVNVRTSEASNVDSANYEDITEDENHQTSSLENENPIIATVNIIADENRDKANLSSENGSVASDNNINDVENYDGIYEQPYTTLVVQNRADNEHVYLITKQNSIYENETSLDDSASEMSCEFLQDTSPGEQKLPVYENVVEEKAYMNFIVNDIDNDFNHLHIDPQNNKAEYINLVLK
ncbi:unnamed protein product [Mytilus coruscus]|uniref:Fibronectin type-III domain-containing protein n=1 Tax=Mytilus coruscus TaxID=42192 RepID=A0A6J8EE92_MYTCO|nr:unnamed protein product [Mytilus coruscus]